MNISRKANLLFRALIFVLVTCCCFSACIPVKVKDWPTGKPFLYDSKIELNKDNLSKDEDKLLEATLANYWVDSLRLPVVQKYIIIKKIIHPPVFDSINIVKSEKLMNSYLSSQGYYQAVFTDSVSIDSTTHPGQKRVSVSLNIDPRKPMVIDSLGYSFKDTLLQKVALAAYKKSKIIPHKTRFTKEAVANELDRLIVLYRNMGYYKLSRNNLIAEVDTTDAALLKLTLDPFEQALKMAQTAARRKENPSAVIIIKQREPSDTLLVNSSKEDFVQYKMGKVNFFPETYLNEIPDSSLLHLDKFPDVFSTRNRFVSIYSREKKFIPRPMLEHLYFKHGDLYQDSSFFKTINNLNVIGSWQQVDYINRIQGDSLNTNIFMVPATKQNITADLEGSWNTGDFISSTNMFGVAVNLTYKNRNVWHRAIQSITNLRNGVELNIANTGLTNDLLQTLQIAGSHSYSFPRFITPFFKIRGKKLDAVSTVLTVNGSYTDRKDYFRLRSFVANWGYEWKKGNSNWQFRPVNFELYSLDTLRLLDTAMKYNPYLTKAFNTGKVISQQLNYNISFPNSRIPGSNYLRFAFEESGAIVGLIKSLHDQIYNYVRLEGEYIKHYDFRKTQFAFRGFAGIGVNYGSTGKFGLTLPFFKQFVAGGPNSMRAWNLRQLGLGSNLQSDTSSSFRDRYGDMQLEMNLEYRYPIFTVGSVKVNGALFTDIGNVWNVKKDPDLPNAEFNINRLGKDVAIAMGTGIRMDFNYVVIRVDFGLKLKDPARLENGGWMSLKNFTWRNDEFANVIPPNPITGKQLYRNNYAVQLGIGLPF
ncbi:BamA/TamA family outer membrane protein [Arachidicoccus soli]|uniref:Bacterial surface antigen (D15) domain-containing protein n=1 Tax=Arachidicoccus soli TaxID=2341117 RepID=A0A386HMJ0_9BACT|nr:BamA/TamA family outer membrane protein [Arachidicoccus soli]AYD46892.1 hypothetical protein D6B99_04240 [Arachidicoccus soli]